MGIFFTDWEGPWTRTDFAYEISKRFFNRTFFERLSQYDDYLYFVERRKDYNAGDTLKLLAPFIAAYAITSEELEKLAEGVASFVPDAKQAIGVLQENFKPVVISTSYMQYLTATAKRLDLREHLHGTEFEVERLSPLFDEEDRAKAAELVKKISTMPEIEVDVERRKLVSGSETVLFLNRVFWGTIKEKQNSFIEKIRDVSKEIKVMGGRRKLEIVKKLVKKYRIGRIIAIGDSISDYEMLGWVKGRGLAVSFNGNGYSLMQSNLAVVSDTAFSEAAVVVAYLSHGMEGVKKLVKMTDSRDWEGVRKLIGDGITEGVVNSETKYYWVGEENFRKVLQDSIRMREKLRGDAGKLG